MTILRTTDRLTKFDARRLTSGGFSIEYIETCHRPDRNETVVVWSRPSQPGDIQEDQIPY